MVKHLLRIGLWLAVLWSGAVAGGVREGMTRAEVEAELGKPLSVLERADVLVLRYPNDGRVEFVGGRASRAVRVRHADDPSTPQDMAAAEEAKAAAAAKREEAVEAKITEQEESSWVKADAEARRKLEESVERLSAEHEAGPDSADLGLGESHPGDFWLMLAVGGLVQVGVGMLVLKLAFKWADVHADWPQMFGPALAGMAGGAAVRAVGFAAWDATEFFRVDDAISYFAMLATLMKTTHACTWQRAFAVAAAAKLMSIIVWVFLGVALANLLFG